MPPLPEILSDYIIKTKEKLNSSNLKTYCKCCIEVLGEEEGKTNFFPNKKDRIVFHLKKCSHFFAKTTPEIRNEIFSLTKNNDLKNLELTKRKCKQFKTFLFCLLWFIFFSNYFFFTALQDISSYGTASDSSGRKVIVRSSSYGPLDNFLVRPLSKQDKEKFNILLIRLTVSCGWALQWVNNPEARELFEFLNPVLKLPDRRNFGDNILKDAVAEGDKAMEITLKEDQIGITLTFDGWTNVKNEQLLGVVVMTSDGRPFVWKAVDISLERETHLEVMEKTEAMISELKLKGVNVCAVVTDSASAYAAAR